MAKAHAKCHVNAVLFLEWRLSSVLGRLVSEGSRAAGSRLSPCESRREVRHWLALIRTCLTFEIQTGSNHSIMHACVPTAAGGTSEGISLWLSKGRERGNTIAVTTDSGAMVTLMCVPSTACCLWGLRLGRCWQLCDCLCS